jgi:hypothetical protein
VGNAEKRSGTEIAGNWLFIREPYQNPFFPLSFSARRSCATISCPGSTARPSGRWSARPGSATCSSPRFPARAIPAIHFLVTQALPAGIKGFTLGLANDQLGYLIAPESGYPQIAAAAPDNDNALFNVSPRIGDHVGCVVLAGAREIGIDVGLDPAQCAPYAAEDHDLPF